MAGSKKYGPDLLLRLTNIDKDGYFIKLTGQVDHEAVSEITRLFEDAREDLENGVGAVSPATLQLGGICAAKHNGAFFRGKIVDTSAINTGLVHVQLIDCGIKVMTAVTNIRGFQNYNPKFLQEAQAYDFHLARIWHPLGTWEDHIIKTLRHQLCGSYFQAKIEMVSNILPMISLELKGIELCTFLVQNQVGVVIDIVGQVLLLHRHIGRERGSYNVLPVNLPAILESDFAIGPRSNQANQAPSNPDNINAQQHVTPGSLDAVPAPRSIPALKTFQNKLLEVNSCHIVCVSFVEEGPQLFQLQLISDSQELQQMMDALNKMPHSCLAEPPMIGTPCLVHTKNDLICRGLVQKVSGAQCTVYLVDFGNTEKVSYYDIYTIPEDFLVPKMFALKFCLSGVRKFIKMTNFMDVFKQIVMEQDLKLEVKEEEGPLIQYGMLYLDGQNVLDLLLVKISENLEFKEIELMQHTSKHTVFVSHVESLIKFHVQLLRKLDELNVMMKAVSVHCENSFSPGELAVGAACCARLGPDSKWYRAVVKGMASRGKVPVLAVDYGYEQTVAAAELRPILPYLMDLPAQAVHCALIGFEDKPPDPAFTDDMKKYALEKMFTAKVSRIDGRVRVVNLTNKTGFPHWDIAAIMQRRVRVWLTVDQFTVLKRPPPRPFSSSESGSDLSDSDVSIEQGPAFEEHSAPISSNEYQQRTTQASCGPPDRFIGPLASTKNNRPPQPSTSTNNRPSKNRTSIERINEPARDGRLSDPVRAGTAYSAVTLVTNKPQDVTVCWFISAANFFVHLKSYEREFRNMMNGIPRMYRGVLPWSGSVPTGAAVLALYTGDGVRYRAKVLGHGPCGYHVRYVDYGNDGTVKAEDIWPLSVRLSHLPQQAIPCSLDGVCITSQERDRIESCFDAQRLTCTFFGCEDGWYSVSLWRAGVSVADTLVDRGLALADVDPAESALAPPAAGQQLSCRLSHGASLRQLFLHRDADRERLDTLLDDMNYFYQLGPAEPLRSLGPGSRCAAKSADGRWYRGAVLAHTARHAAVRFTDRGHSELVPRDHVKLLLHRFCELPALALEVSLGVDPLRSDAVDKLMEWCKEERLEVTLGPGRSGDVWLASLFLDRVDLAAKLIEENLATPIVTEEQPPSSPLDGHLAADKTTLTEANKHMPSTSKSIDTAMEHNIECILSSNSTASAAACDNLPSTSESVHAIPLLPVVKEPVTADDNQINNNDATQRVAERSTQITDTADDLIQF